jgi:lipopolysaccharide transport system permease protein
VPELQPLNKGIKWDWEIKPESSWFGGSVKEVWAYRHLLLRLIRRDFLTNYQQTLLGPLWIVFQPLLTMFMYVLIFDRAIKLSHDGLPSFPFYLAGIIVWNLFAECFTTISSTFSQNAALFGKVYFPRIIMPLSVVAMNLVRFGIQFIIFMIILIYYILINDLGIFPLRWLYALPLILICVSGIGFGAGLFFSILTAKYRDLTNIIHLVMRLLMFATPVFYPISMFNKDYQWIISINPIAPMIEFFRFAFLGQGTFTETQLLYSFSITILVVFFGVLLYNKMSGKLLDVV